ncbi:MFS transporter [Pseudonocardia sp. ICBG1293]|uniref:MFS transporter n=1 Tax=Pseudonocardia sp. ICBG1293 TaxID=2844382 RepID=UPI001CCAC369|nr:MFS transporter [Pseudonocardia sp. ICBG1293]
MPQSHDPADTGLAGAAHPSPGTARASTRLVALYVLAQFGLWTALLTPVTVSLALKVAGLDGANKATGLGLILGVGAFIAMICMPLWGALSDRTTSRFGRRRPWLAAGVVVGGVGLVVVVLAPNMLVVGLGWCLCQAAFNATQAALNAILPDYVPDEQRGRVSGLLGLTPISAVLLGTLIVQVVGSSSAWTFLVPLAVAAVFVGLLVAVLPDRPAGTDPAAEAPVRSNPLEFVRGFWISPRRHPDFAWAFLSRFLFFTGAAFLLTYQVYFLTDGLGVPTAEVAGRVFVSTLVSAAVTITVSVLGGWLSDRIGRRKPLVLVAAMTGAVGLLTIGTSTTFTQFLIGSAVTSVGTGLYHAIDLALVASVLPNPDDAAKDMGTFQIASSIPQSLAPTIAPVFLLLGNGEYVAVFVAAAVFAVLGAIAIQPVRGVR